MIEKILDPDKYSVAIFHLDKKRRIQTTNKHAQQFCAASDKELSGRPLVEVLCHDLSPCPLSELLDMAERGKATTKKTVYLGDPANTTANTVIVSVLPFPEKQNSNETFMVTLQDSTDQSFIHHLLLDSIQEGVITVDTNLLITSFNKAAERITGWRQQDAIGKKCNAIFPNEICGKNCLIKQSIIEEKSVSVRTVFMKRKHGDTFSLSLTSSPLYGPNNRLIGGVTTLQDNTGIIHNDLLLASVADGVFTVDINSKITTFNKSAEQITGWSKEEAIGKSCREIFQSSICGDGCRLIQSINDNRSYSNNSIFIKHKNGTSIPVSISSAPLIDDFGNIIGGIETFCDNTHSIRESLILDSIADGVFTVDRNWNITSFNDAAAEITGWPPEEALGKSCSEIFHSSICGKNCAIAESLYTGAPVANRSITIRNHQGETVPISISAAPLTDHEGNIIGGVETFRDLTTITSLRKQLHQKFTFDEIISKSASMQRLFSIMPDIARSQSTVLVLGESGTGKELIARALFNASERKDKPFVVVNCGALPETLLESELFGYKAGAFTDAKKDRQGRFAAAEGGTLFLDEIGDIPASVQVKLLRVLQEKVYEPLGSNTPLKANVRIITATNRNLQALVNEGLFRDDLFYRLNVVKINLPPLRERKEDIPLLVDHFTKKYSALQGKDIVGISSAALTILMRHDFPGNIRELENIIEYAFILCEGGYIQPQHLPDPFSPISEGLQEKVSGDNIPQTLEDIEKQSILLALDRNKWKKMATCRELDISKDTLRRKISRYQLINPVEEQIKESQAQ